MPIEIEIEQPGHAKRIVLLSKPVTVIGRSEKCDLVLPGATVSSRHSVLKIYSDGGVIEDLGSANGTWINGHRISGATKIDNGARIDLGKDGPTIRILNGSSASHKVIMPESAVIGHNKKSSVWIVAGGTGLLLGLMVLVCGIGGIGVAWIAWRWNSNSVHSVTEHLKIRQALGKVIVGITLTKDGVNQQVPFSVGTGFVITPNGYVITNKHVVEDAANMDATQRAALASKLKFSDVSPRVWFNLGDITEEAEIVHISQEFDFSLLKINRTDLPYFRIASSADVPRLANIYALGFPDISTKPVSDEEILEEQIRQSGFHANVRDYFKSSDFDYDSTSGTISRVRKEQLGRIWVQHNAAINGGNSGGPLCLDNGIVVGINTLSMKDSQGVFFALALSQLQEEIQSHEIKATWVNP